MTKKKEFNFKLELINNAISWLTGGLEVSSTSVNNRDIPGWLLSSRLKSYVERDGI